MQFVNVIDPGVSKTQPPGYVLAPLRGDCAAKKARATAEERMRDHIQRTRYLAFSSGVRPRLTRSLTRVRSESMGLHASHV